MYIKACAFTGYAPIRFNFGCDEEDEQYKRLKLVLARQIGALIEDRVSVFYSTMALGVGQWSAESILHLKRQYPHIRLVAVLPCETQANGWSFAQRERYFNTLAQADDVITLRAHYTPQCGTECIRYIVDRAEYLLAVYDGSPKGGAAYAVRYAREKNRRITIIHPDTLEAVPSLNTAALERRKRLYILPGK